NPYLKVTGTNTIELNPMSADPTLASFSIAPLYDESLEDNITYIELITGFATINTDGSNRYLNVSAQVEEGMNVTLVSQEVTTKVNEYLASTDFTQHGLGYSVAFEGENEEILEAVSELTIAALV